MTRMLMATDMFNDPYVMSRRLPEWPNLYARFRHYYGVLDLDLPPGPDARQYIIPSIDGKRVTSNVINTIRFLNSHGAKCVIAINQEPDVRHPNNSRYMAGLGYKHHEVNELYTPARFWHSVDLWKDLLGQVGNILWGVVPYLEPSTPTSVIYCRELSKIIRKQLGYRGHIFSTGIGHGYWEGSTSLLVEGMTSINYFSRWDSAIDPWRSSDGMVSISESELKYMATHPGSRGSNLWLKDFVGNNKGAGRWEPWMNRAVPPLV